MDKGSTILKIKVCTRFLQNVLFLVLLFRSKFGVRGVSNDIMILGWSNKLCHMSTLCYLPSWGEAVLFNRIPSALRLYLFSQSKLDNFCPFLYVIPRSLPERNCHRVLHGMAGSERRQMNSIMTIAQVFSYKSLNLNICFLNLVLKER